MALEQSGWVRITAASMAVVLVGWTAVLAAPTASSVSGTVLTGDDPSTGSGPEGSRPLAGAKIHLSHTGDGRWISSEPTGADGNFRIAGVESATYEVAVEHNGGLYLVERPVHVEAGEPLALNLMIRPSASVPVAAPRARRGAGGILASPLAATLMVAGSALTLGAVIESATSDDSDPVASQFLRP